ncbi:MAG: exo-alpha-sialidase [Planctomycetes bacterium]|nr:exo-alpha-sialidase [Planctomycetota bacterium]
MFRLLLAQMAVAPALVGQHTFPPQYRRDDSTVASTAILREADLAVDGDAACCVWLTDYLQEQLLFSRSGDRGDTWSVPATIPGGPDWTVFASGVKVAAAAGRLVVAWTAWGITGGQAWLAVSDDRGVSWNVRSVSNCESCRDVFLAGDAIVCLAEIDVFVTRDAGVSWSGPRPIGRAGSNLGAVGGRVLLEHRGQELFATWTEVGAGPAARTYYNTSSDLGRSWLSSDRPLGVGSALFSTVVGFAVGSTGVFVLLVENGGYSLQRSLDGGVTWNAVSLPFVPLSAAVRFAFDGAHLLVGWMTSSSGVYDAWVARSLDGGATWIVGAQSIYHTNTHPTGWVACHGGDGAFVLAFRTRLPLWFYSITTIVSADGGGSWAYPSAPVSSQLADAPKFVADRAAWFAVWHNTLTPVLHSHLRFAWLAGPRRRSGGVAPAGGTKPLLTTTRIPVLGFDGELELRDALPGAFAVLALGRPRTGVTFLAGRLSMQPQAVYPLLLGAPNSQHPGTATLGFRLPVHGGVSEFRAQAFVLDPAAPYGVAMSDAVDVRLL